MAITKAPRQTCLSSAEKRRDFSEWEMADLSQPSFMRTPAVNLSQPHTIFSFGVGTLSAFLTGVTVVA